MWMGLAASEEDWLCVLVKNIIVRFTLCLLMERYLIAQTKTGLNIQKLRSMDDLCAALPQPQDEWA